MPRLLLLLLLVGCTSNAPLGPDWSRDAELPEGGDRANIYSLPDAELTALREEGARLASSWPVDVSGTLVPYQPLRRILDEDSDDPTIQTGRELGRVFLGFDSMDALYDWVGMPVANPPGLPHPYENPLPADAPSDRLGVSVLDTELGEALTFSCDACHAGRLLGRTVFGLGNRLSRANSFFEFGKGVVGFADPEILRSLGDATDGEVEMLIRTSGRLGAVGIKEPETLGLDTSLAQVGLSLARRGDDPYATRGFQFESSPRPSALLTEVADSKPMPWWTLKYKTRWLADGSIVAGNPVHTNFLWNELGRGTDLPALGEWLGEHPDAVRALTAAAFASEPPRWTDFFPASSVDLEEAGEGHGLYEQRCASCHGSYRKRFDEAGISAEDRLRTEALAYAPRTEVVDVGTDEGRARGMADFADTLNGLALSQELETEVEVQQGYVPPPLDGIWARYPYLHNGSVPTLCALLSPASSRPSSFVQGPSEQASDFDAQCVGYPTGDAIPAWWEAEGAIYDTTRPGMSNGGHEEMSAGLSEDERAALITFLRTL